MALKLLQLFFNRSRNDAMIAGLKRTCGFQDDVLVNGRTIEEHNTNLFALFERIKEWGFHIRLEKCSFFLTEIRYLGFIIDENGRRPDPSKIEAICNMPEQIVRFLEC